MKTIARAFLTGGFLYCFPARVHTVSSLLIRGTLAVGALFLTVAAIAAQTPGGARAPVSEMVDRCLAAHRYSGVVRLVACDGRIVDFQATGMADIEAGRAMRRDSIFRLASMSKVVTAVAIMILADEGKLAISDPVDNYIPEFRHMKVDEPGSISAGHRLVDAQRPITIRDLLTHTSGLGSGPVGLKAIGRMPSSPTDTLAVAIPRLAASPLEFQPGSRFAYSGLAGFDTLGRIVEVVSGMELEAFFRRRIFEPLGMKDTTFAPTAVQRDRMVTLYTRTGDQLVRAANQYPLLDPVYQHGAGGLVGTAGDYWKFAQMLANGGLFRERRILKESTAALMASLILPDTFPGLGRGMGWGLSVRCITQGEIPSAPLAAGSYGWSGAWGTHFWIDPKRKVVAVLMGNESGAGGAGAQSARDFEVAVSRAMDGPAAAELRGPQQPASHRR